MTKKDLIRTVQEKVKDYPLKDVSYAVHVIFDALIRALIEDERIEIRGFGNFTVKTRNPRTGRNPKTSEAVHLPERRIPVFKSGKEIRHMINTSA
ncbi:MAG: integration host factor subunit beta [Deltaproteobacteria bacterium]|nr:integration host factor subunit beta [Deltaproteobacteria bacterium]